MFQFSGFFKIMKCLNLKENQEGHNNGHTGEWSSHSNRSKANKKWFIRVVRQWHNIIFTPSILVIQLKKVMKKWCLVLKFIPLKLLPNAKFQSYEVSKKSQSYIRSLTALRKLKSWFLQDKIMSHRRIMYRRFTCINWNSYSSESYKRIKGLLQIITFLMVL